MPDDRKTTWLSYRHPRYQRWAGAWQYAWDHYTAALLEDSAIDDYLVVRPVGETPEAFKERKKLADYTPHFSSVVDALAGMLFSVEAEANRTLVDESGQGIGKHTEAGTLAWRLWRDADGRGNGWVTIWKQLAIKLVVFRVAWVLVDSQPNGDPAVKVFSPLEVVNWRESQGRLVDVVVREHRDVRGSIEQQPSLAERFLHFGVQGWRRLKEVEATDGSKTVSEVETGAYSFQDPGRQPALPIFRVELPLERPIGYMLARKANAIFNKESERDHLLRVANFPLLNLVADNELFAALVKKLKKGARALQVDPGHASSQGAHHGFIAPSAEPARIQTDVLKRKVEEFYVTAFREFGDAAREKTATEVRQSVSAGVGAFLQMLKAAVDDAENGALWRVEQQQFPSDRERWFVASVRRSDNFSPLNLDEVIKRLKERYFGTTDGIPLGRTGIVNAARKIAEHDGVDFDASELEEAIEASLARGQLEDLLELPVPSIARAALVVQLLEAHPQLDLNEEVEMTDGSRRALREVIRDEALRLAEAQDQEAQRGGLVLGL